jgi:hypothetical protein
MSERDDPISLVEARLNREQLKQMADRLAEALLPFAGFAGKAEQFVAERAKDGGSPIMPPVKDFRLSDFQRAAGALAAYQTLKSSTQPKPTVKVVE